MKSTGYNKNVKENNGNYSKTYDLYAEIISSSTKGDENDTTNNNNNKDKEKLPPMKILLNKHITSTAVDSIRDSIKDSKDYLNMLARELLLGILHDNKNQHIFGDFLKYTFSYESVLLPTRELVYWSLYQTDTFQTIQSYINYQVLQIISPTASLSHNIIKKSIVNSAIYNINDKAFKTCTLNPLIVWTLQQRDIVIDPLSKIIIDALPYVKVCLR